MSSDIRSTDEESDESYDFLMYFNNMADISIYGTLVNETGEAIARADQVIDPVTGRMVSELLQSGSSGGLPAKEMTAEDIAEIAAEVEAEHQPVGGAEEQTRIINFKL